MKRKLHILVVALLALGMVGIIGARPTYAATDVVTTCAASGTDSLPAVVAAAAAGDTITFNQDCSGANAIKMGTSGAFQPIEINKDLTIDGTGHTIVVDGGNKTRLFDVDPGVNVPVVHLIGLTLSNGTCPGCDGGAIFSNEGTVIITNSTLSGNSATEDTVNYLLARRSLGMDGERKGGLRSLFSTRADVVPLWRMMTAVSEDGERDAPYSRNSVAG